ncbi:hypothetical protein [Micromonospora sp. CPCC 205714]
MRLEVRDCDSGLLLSVDVRTIESRAEFDAAAAAIADRLKLRQLVSKPVQQPWEIRAAATGGGPCSRCQRPFYTHVCLGCSPDYQTPGPGCVNCRNTGMDQTPCLPPKQPRPPDDPV